MPIADSFGFATLLYVCECLLSVINGRGVIEISGRDSALSDSCTCAGPRIMRELGWCWLCIWDAEIFL